jgi:hypothetical protein
MKTQSWIIKQGGKMKTIEKETAIGALEKAKADWHKADVDLWKANETKFKANADWLKAEETLCRIIEEEEQCN